MVGLVFSKLSRPRNRSKTIIFSNQAVVTKRNDRLCLIIRIGDLRDDNFILGTQISAKLLRRRTSVEGEVYQVDMMLVNVSVHMHTANKRSANGYMIRVHYIMSGDVAAGNNPGHSRRALHLLRLAHRGKVNIDTIA